MCEDIFGCTHEPETPISDNGHIVAWVCRCGQVKTEVTDGEGRKLEDGRDAPTARGEVGTGQRASQAATLPASDAEEGGKG